MAGCQGSGDGATEGGPSGGGPGTPGSLGISARASGTDQLLQALSPVDDSVVWVSGHGGTWGRSLDGGVTWQTEVVPGAESLQFRDVQGFDRDTAVLMSAGDGDLSRMFRTEDGGRSWTETFRMEHPNGFLDCMDFVDRDLGFAYGDAVDGGLYLLRTRDGGRSWTRVPPDPLPGALDGEGGFAASGACISVSADRVIIGTGNGPRPRALAASLDASNPGALASWAIKDLPMTSGPSSGATALHMGADGWGFAVGGAIGEHRDGARVVMTEDGGATWSPAPGPPIEGPLYGAARMAALGPRVLAVVGPGGLAWSEDAGASWAVLDSDALWAVAFGPSGSGWAVGPGGRILALAPGEVASGVGDQLRAQVDTAGVDLLVEGGRLFDGTGDEAVPNPGILIRDGRIVRLGVVEGERAAAGGYAGGTRVLRLPDHATVLPGLFDLHAHYAVDLFGEGRVDETRINPLVFLANGVTSTFPAGEVDPATFDELEASLAAGRVMGPRLHRSGPYFGSARPGWDHEAMTPDSIRAEVAAWAGAGAAGFKAKGIQPVQLAALVEEAHRYGLTVTAHLDSGFRNSVNPRAAIEMGIDRVEHFLGGDVLSPDRNAYASIEVLDLDDSETDRLLREQIARFVQNGVRFDATLSAYDYWAAKDPEVYTPFRDEMALLTPYARSVVESRLPRRPLDQFERVYRVKHGTVRLFVENGGGDLLTVGTDHPSWGEYFSGFSIHRELHALSRAGVPNEVVLRAATANAAAALGLEELGTVEEGKLADLVIVSGDPLSDITATRDVLWVVRNGAVFDPGWLLERAWGRLGPAGQESADWWKGSLRLGR